MLDIARSLKTAGSIPIQIIAPLADIANRTNVPITMTERPAIAATAEYRSLAKGLELSNRTLRLHGWKKGRLMRTRLIPYAIDEELDSFAPQSVNFTRVVSVLREHKIEQRDIGYDLLNLRAQCVVRQGKWAGAARLG